MTELLTRPPLADTPPGDQASQDAALWWRGCLAALWAVALGVAALLVVVLVVWAADSRSGASAAEAIRSALLVWLAAHKVALHTAGGELAVAPLGLTLLLGLLVARAAAVLARGRGVDGPAGVALVAAAVGLPYAVLSSFVAAAAHSSAVAPAPLGALVGGLVVGVLAAAVGAARGASVTVLDAVPVWLRDPLAAGAMAVGVLASAALLLVLGSLIVHASTAAELAGALGGGMVAQASMLALGALLVPNAVIAATSYLAGPGFAVGTGTSVTMAGAHLGAVPSLPLLAALPHGSAPVPVVAGAVVAILAAGVLAGRRAVRSVADEGVLRTAGRAAAAGPVAGLLSAVLAAVAGGPAGPGRMSAVGASPWQAGLVVTGEVGLVAAGTAVVLAWWSARR